MAAPKLCHDDKMSEWIKSKGAKMPNMLSKGRRPDSFFRLLIALIMALTSLSLCAEQLILPLKGKDVPLSYWPAQNHQRGALIWVRAEPSMMPENMVDTISANGWAILLMNAKPDTELNRQIPAAIRALRKLHYPRVILLHQGDRLQNTLDYFSRQPSKRVDGFIFLSAYESKKNMNISGLSSPIMDICGQFDYQYVISDFKKRKEQERDRNYQSIQIPGADYRYEYQLKMLAAYMDGWMKKIPAIQPVWLPFQQ